MRFFHMYTGYIVMVIILSASAVSWLYYDTQTVFFENWSCLNIMKLALNFNAHEQLTEIVHERFHVVLNDCFVNEKFFRFEH